MSGAVAYNPMPNQFRRDLLAGKRLIGCWSSLGSLITTEVLGLAGFDWLLLDDCNAALPEHGLHHSRLCFCAGAQD